MTPKPTHRLKIEYVDPHSLKPWKGNPRVMSKEEHEKLKKSLREFGIVDPLIVRRRDNLVIGGHQRLEDLLELGFARVPVVYREHLSDRQTKALNIALNKIHGDWDDEKLASILAELKDLPEATLTGFDEAEIDKIIADVDIPNLGAMEPSGKTQGLCLVPYLGGKQKLASRLISMMPEHMSYVEVFGGGASVLLNKPRSQIEVYNDLDGELVNLFEVIRDDPDVFLEHSKYLLYSRELFEQWQREATGGSPPAQDPVERAFRFWYVLRCSFGGQAGKGWAFSRAEPRSGALVLQNALTEIRTIHERLLRVEIDHLDFRRLIENRDAPSTFMFLDPPYLDTEQYRVGKFTLDDHKALAELLSKAKGKWLMTVGDHPEIRSLYADQLKGALDSSLCIEQVIGGERGTYRNLIVSNYPLPQEMQQVAQEA
jgi:DNA adenine methylase